MAQKETGLNRFGWGGQFTGVSSMMSRTRSFVGLLSSSFMHCTIDLHSNLDILCFGWSIPFWHLLRSSEIFWDGVSDAFSPESFARLPPRLWSWHSARAVPRWPTLGYDSACDSGPILDPFFIVFQRLDWIWRRSGEFPALRWLKCYG